MVLTIQIGSEPDGKWFWTIREAESKKAVARGNSAGYETEQQALASLFSIFFGDFDSDNFMDLFNKWQAGVPKADRLTNRPNLV